MQAHFNYISQTLNITKEVANQCFHSGYCDEDVKRNINIPYYKRQLSKIDKSELISELNEYGAWDEIELQDHNANLERIFWIACGDIVDHY